jgi:hypothetical protein
MAWMQGRSWAWFCLTGSLLFLAGGVLNLLKVFKTQQMGGRGMEKLRGGAQERLAMEREGKVPLILEHGGGRRGPTTSRAPWPCRRHRRTGRTRTRSSAAPARNERTNGRCQWQRAPWVSDGNKQEEKMPAG